MDKNNMRSISGRFLGGTAKMISSPSILSTKKDKREIFWAKALLSKLKSCKDECHEVISNEDDSNGQDDVIIKFASGDIGVQITEMIYSHEYAKKKNRTVLIDKIIKELQTKNIKSDEKIVLTINSKFKEIRSNNPKDIDKIISKIINVLENKKSNEDIHIIRLKGEDSFHIPHINNIGIEFSFDLVPRDLASYMECIEAIAKRKEKSKSEWLIITSLNFLRDRHWLEKEVVEHMINVFKDSSFSRVYFVESMDGDGWFQANLKVYSIKKYA